MRKPKSKKKRIQNKYIPKGIYCHKGLNYVCPFWRTRLATNSDMRKIYEREHGYFDATKNLTLDEFIKYVEQLPEEEAMYFKHIVECTCIHYTEYCQDTLLWDMVKECNRNDEKTIWIYSRKMPNKARRMNPSARRRWLEKNHTLPYSAKPVRRDV